MSNYNEALEWAARWIETSIAPDDNDRTKEFAGNMAMSIRAAKLKMPEPTLDDVQCEWLLAQEEAQVESWCKRFPQFADNLREFAAINEAMEKLPERTYTAEETARLEQIAQDVVAKVLKEKTAKPVKA